MKIVLIDVTRGAPLRGILSAFIDLSPDPQGLGAKIAESIGGEKGDSAVHISDGGERGRGWGQGQEQGDPIQGDPADAPVPLPEARGIPYLGKRGREIAASVFRTLSAKEGEKAESVISNRELVGILGVAKAIEELGLADARFYTTAVGAALTSAGRCGDRAAGGEEGGVLEMFKATGTPALFRPSPTGTTQASIALIYALTAGKDDPPPLRIERVGRWTADGGGVQVILGEGVIEGASDEIAVIETNVDDLDGETLGWIAERLRRVVEEVSLIPYISKKGRPGFTIRAVATREQAEGAMEAILAESGSLGLKVFRCQRVAVEREECVRTVRVGRHDYDVRVKVSKRYGRVKPEFEDCKRIAVQEGLTFREVAELVRRQLAEQ